MTKPRLEIDCPEHGLTFALPIVNEAFLQHTEWPTDAATLEALPRFCAKCLAERMVNPIRRCAA